ncbi:MAG: NTP transferase domain-containing protein [Solirubrobacterales bacterium]|nr:NTP transferase domain-containing protein [Solirubrobacterales bacterium]
MPASEASPPLQTVILAGGLATRLRPVTERLPKALVPVLGEPFVGHQLRLLKGHGLERIVLCVGYLGEQIEAYVGDGSRFGLRVTYVYDGPTLLGTGGALRQALPWLDRRFFVLYGDSYLPCAYAAVQAAFAETGKAGLMTVHRNEGCWDTSNVEFVDGLITGYDKRSPRPTMRYIDYGLGVLSRDALAGVPAAGRYDLADLYRALLDAGELAGFEIQERFYEVGSRSGIEALSAYLRRQSVGTHPPP